MAKGVTEDDLASGIRSMGGLGTLSRTRRDSPFRDTRAEEPTEKTVQVELAKEAPRAIEAQAVREISPVEVEGRSEKPKALVPRTAPPEKPRPEKKKTPQRKADVYTERVTLQISPKMRDEVDELARQLQRAKSSKDERITANTVMRVAIQAFLEAFELDRSACPNNEAELLDSFKGRR